MGSRYNPRRMVDGVELKRCSGCKQYLNLSEFYKCLSKKDGLQTFCKKCQHIHSIKPERQIDSRKSKLKKFGLTDEDYVKLFIKQNGRCYLCREKVEGNFCIDHNHKTGKVRGLLCSWCNKGIGFLQDNPELLRRAADYLDGF
jgi:hypothetical protein